MRSTPDIEVLLDRLSGVTADELEGQDVDFKRWESSGGKAATDMAVEMAVCMANGGGGSVVFGIADGVIGRGLAILGVPPDVKVAEVQRAVYDKTDPHITPVIDTILVTEGTGRVLVMHVLAGMRPYTDSSGRAKVRVGKECKPLLGTHRAAIGAETGATDFTAEVIGYADGTSLSPAAMERLRAVARREQAPADLLSLSSDVELLDKLGLVRQGRLTRAAILIAGKAEAVRSAFPHYVWTHLRMRGDVDYSDRADGFEALPVALQRIEDRIAADNPLMTVKNGLFHAEYRTYPELALREALLNAFCHADYRRPGVILVSQSAGGLEISNPGGFYRRHHAREHPSPSAGPAEPAARRRPDQAKARQPQ